MERDTRGSFYPFLIAFLLMVLVDFHMSIKSLQKDVVRLHNEVKFLKEESEAKRLTDLMR